MAAVRIDKVRTPRCNGHYSVTLYIFIAPFAWMFFYDTFLGVFPGGVWGRGLEGSPPPPTVYIKFGGYLHNELYLS